MILADLLKTKYAHQAQSEGEYNCWGLVRLARKELFNRPDLPSHSDINATDKRRLSTAAAEVIDGYLIEIDEPREGAIVAAYQGRLCVHVGIIISVDNRLVVLETDTPTGPVLTRLETFVVRYYIVAFYD